VKLTWSGVTLLLVHMKSGGWLGYLPIYSFFTSLFFARSITACYFLWVDFLYIGRFSVSFFLLSTTR
jgi:hypothetical protein